MEANGAALTATPFWGPPTALDDSAEPNYVYSPYVGEFWAAVTSVMWVGLSVLSFRASRYMPVATLYILHGLAGLSGIVYHTTLLFFPQMIDRAVVVMWMFCTVYNLALLHDHVLPRRSNAQHHQGEGDTRHAVALLLSTHVRPQPRLAILACGTIAVVSSYFDRNAPVFVALVFASVWTAHPLTHRVAPDLARLWRFGLLSSALALLCFALDRRIDHVSRYFHVWWHLTAAYATNVIMGFVLCAQADHMPPSAKAAHGGKRRAVRPVTLWGVPVWFQ